MKILILLDSLAIGGGAERISTTLGDEFHNLNHEVHYLTFQDTLDQDNGQNIECKNIFKRGYNFVKNSKKITDLCKNLEIDTLLSVGEVANIHAVSSSMFHNNPALIIISQHINPLIHVHSKLKVRFINFFYSRASKTVCVSKEIETLLNRYFNVNNTTNINNMIDLEKINSLATEATDLDKVFLNSIDDVGSIFINIGSLIRQKGHWFLIRSFNRVVEQHPDSKLFILGEGPLRDELEKLIRELGLQDHVFLLGNKSNVFPYLKNSSCFVFSSLWEGLPMTLIEALSFNLPIISTDCMTGPREALCPELNLKEELNYPYFGKYGILNHPFQNELSINTLEELPLNSAEEMMADLMIEIMENLKLKEKYSNGKEMAWNFDRKKIIKEWEDLLTEKF